MERIQEIFRKARVVPVISPEGQADARKLGQALVDGGMLCAEVTFRSQTAPECLSVLTGNFPGLCSGAGTILNVEQARLAKSCGARFVVTPAFNARVVDYCLEQELPVIPGICTPYEVELALRKGLDFLKFFPAQVGGTAMLKALSGPYRFVTFMPTGGITVDNLNSYLALENVAACGASWLAPSKLIEAGDFDAITARCRQTLETSEKIHME